MGGTSWLFSRHVVFTEDCFISLFRSCSFLKERRKIEILGLVRITVGSGGSAKGVFYP